jgi:hypothetical protein
MPFRKEFEEAIGLVAHAATIAAKQGASRPVLVGGAAVELYTGGAVTSGDFDLVTSDDEKLLSALEAVGFKRLNNIDYQLTHPVLGMAVEFVRGPLMDGKADVRRIKVFKFGDNQLAVIPIEDLIADRLGQAFSSRPPRKDLIDQARTLFRVASNPDSNYLDRRIVEETAGEASIKFLERP